MPRPQIRGSAGGHGSTDLIPRNLQSSWLMVSATHVDRKILLADSISTMTIHVVRVVERLAAIVFVVCCVLAVIPR